MNPKVKAAILLGPVAFVVLLYFWVQGGLPTPRFMGAFREEPLRIFALLLYFGGPYYLGLLMLHSHYDVLRSADEPDEPLPEYLRPRRPDEVESIAAHLFTRQARINFAWAFCLTGLVILFGSIFYFEGVNEGTTYFNQTYEQTGGWGILNIVIWSAIIAVAFTVWAADRDRKRPVFIPEALERMPGIKRS